jgi:hypothetical protein
MPAPDRADRAPAEAGEDGESVEHTMPENLCPSETTKAWFVKRGGSPEQLERHFDEFVRHARAHGMRVRNWDAFFQKYLLNRVSA